MKITSQEASHSLVICLQIIITYIQIGLLYGQNSYAKLYFEVQDKWREDC